MCTGYGETVNGCIHLAVYFGGSMLSSRHILVRFALLVNQIASLPPFWLLAFDFSIIFWRIEKRLFDNRRGRIGTGRSGEHI